MSYTLGCWRVGSACVEGEKLQWWGIGDKRDPIGDKPKHRPLEVGLYILYTAKYAENNQPARIAGDKAS